MSGYPLYMQGTLDAQSEAILAHIAEAKYPSVSSLTPHQARQYPFDASWVGSPNPGVRIENLSIRGSREPIPLRIYTCDEGRSYPILLFFHGGGFVLSTLNEYDAFCSFLASGVPCMVVSVDYRLAPEHKYPAAIEDAVTAMNWVAAHAQDFRGDSLRIAVAGDSAGGNLATVTSIIARDRGFPALRHQVLICPWVDLSSFATDSFRFFGDGLWASKANILWYRNHYLQNQEQAFDPFVSPLLTGNLSGLPSAFVITAEFDVLRDEGEAYAHRMEEAGVSVQHKRYRGMLHDFPIFPGLFDQANTAIGDICSALQKAYQ